jgi:hypothetical protein
MSLDRGRLLSPPVENGASGSAIIFGSAIHAHAVSSDHRQKSRYSLLVGPVAEQLGHWPEVAVVLILSLRNARYADWIPRAHEYPPQTAGPLSLPPGVVIGEFHILNGAPGELPRRVR